MFPIPVFSHAFHWWILDHCEPKVVPHPIPWQFETQGTDGTSAFHVGSLGGAEIQPVKPAVRWGTSQELSKKCETFPWKKPGGFPMIPDEHHEKHRQCPIELYGLDIWPNDFQHRITYNIMDGCNLPKILGGKSWEGCKFEAPNLDHCFICRFTPLEMGFEQPDTLSLSFYPQKKKTCHSAYGWSEPNRWMENSWRSGKIRMISNIYQLISWKTLATWHPHGIFSSSSSSHWASGKNNPHNYPYYHTEAEKEPVQNWLILAHNMLMCLMCHLLFRKASPQVVWGNLPSFHIFSPPFPTCPRRDPSRRRKRSNALHAAANHRLANVPPGHTWPRGDITWYNRN